jgi:hypothetical protein
MTFKKGLYHYWPIFVFLVGAFLFVAFMVWKFGVEDINQFILIASVLCLAVVLPTVYLHIRYYLYTLDDKLEVNQDNFSYEHRGKKISFGFKDIKQIISYKTPPAMEKRLHWLPWASYNFTEIILQDDSSVILTCYLVNEPEFKINGQEFIVHKEKKLFPDLGIKRK